PALPCAAPRAHRDRPCFRSDSEARSLSSPWAVSSLARSYFDTQYGCSPPGWQRPGRHALTHLFFEIPRFAQPVMQLSRSVVVATALAAFWSPFAAAACARDRLMDPPPFAAQADAGNSAAITTHKTKRMTYLRFRF